MTQRPPGSTAASFFFQVTGTLALEISQQSTAVFPSVTSTRLSSSFSMYTDAAAGGRKEARCFGKIWEFYTLEDTGMSQICSLEFVA